jgi:hypothetical protein
MTATPEVYAAARDHEPTVEAVSHAPVLISAQEVMLGSAVAVRQRPTMMRRWTEAASVVAASVRDMLATSRPDDRPAHRDYPKRYAFLEYATMAREMERL